MSVGSTELHPYHCTGTTIFADYMVLLTREAESSDSFWRYVGLVYRPFTWQLWLVIGGITIVLGLWIWFNERNQGTYLQDAVFVSMNIFCPGSDGYRAPQKGGRILMLATGSFVLITTATYGANLASFLVTDGLRTSGVQTFADVFERRQTLCVIQAFEQQVWRSWGWFRVSLWWLVVLTLLITAAYFGWLLHNKADISPHFVHVAYHLQTAGRLARRNQPLQCGRGMGFECAGVAPPFFIFCFQNARHSVIPRS